MKAAVDTPRIFVFDAPAAELLMEADADYYRECQLAGEASVEIELLDHSTVILSATRYLPADTSVGVVVIDGVLRVICTSGSGEPVTMREFTDWARYTVHRAAA